MWFAAHRSLVRLHSSTENVTRLNTIIWACFPTRVLIFVCGRRNRTCWYPLYKSESWREEKVKHHTPRNVSLQSSFDCKKCASPPPGIRSSSVEVTTSSQSPPGGTKLKLRGFKIKVFSSEEISGWKFLTMNTLSFLIRIFFGYFYRFALSPSKRLIKFSRSYQNFTTPKLAPSFTPYSA